MKKMGRVLLLLFLAVSLLTGFIPNEVRAQSNYLENVLVLRDDGIVVRVDYNAYKTALRYKDDLYNFLVNSQGFINIYGISSGDKYIHYNEYKLKMRYDAEGVISDAIELSESIVESEVLTFHKLVINEDGTFSTEPIFDKDPGQPSVTGTYRKLAEQKFGFVVTEVNNIPDASKFRVEYYITQDGVPITEETDIFNIGDEAYPVFYDENGEHPYNTVNIIIYDEAEEVLERFDGIILNVIATARTSTQLFFISK